MDKPDDKPGFPAQNQIRAFDVAGLYVLEIVTDMVAGQVQKLTPVDEHGVRDVGRSVRFFSTVTVNHGSRPYNVPFELPAKSLSEALAMFSDEGAKAAMAFLDKLETERVRSQLQGQRSGAGPMPKLVVPH